MYKNAIVRKPGINLINGITTANLGSPLIKKALLQHENYCSALKKCGLELTVLEADLRYPDSTFVEDTAVIIERCAVIANPGAESRKGEEVEIKAALSGFYTKFYTISSPGTLDGGDVCEASSHFFIGISERTNEAGGRQLSEYLAREGYTSSFVNIRDTPSVLHLKSGMACLGDNTMVLIDDFADMDIFRGYNVIRVAPEENYASNCIRVNDFVLLAVGYPRLKDSIVNLGYECITLNMSEFRKMDGGLSCLSLRF